MMFAEKEKEGSVRTTPTSVSVAVFIERDGKLLLVRQAEKGGGWGPPAGHVELGETIVQAAKRETREETGLEVEPVNLVGIYTVQEPERLKIGFVFRGRVVGGEIGLKVSEVAELRWFSRQEVAELVEKGNLYKPEYNRPGLADWLAGKSYSLEVLKEGF